MNPRKVVLILFLLLAGVRLVFAQDSGRSAVKHSDDLSALFPEISGCVKVVTSHAPAQDTFRLEIAYERRGYEKHKSDPNYLPCGSITIHRAPGIGKPREPDPFQFPPPEKFDVQGREAWRYSPWCGNDPSLPYTVLHLSDDQLIELTAVVGFEAIPDFVNDADLALISDRIRIWLR